MESNSLRTPPTPSQIPSVRLTDADLQALSYARKLTDAELRALSYAHFDKQFDYRTYEDLAGKTVDGNHIISGWGDVTDIHSAEHNAQLREAMLSLERFGLVDSYYESRTPTHERVVETKPNGHMVVAEAGWRYRITEAGSATLRVNQAFRYRCCDGCVHLPCVCSERTFCAEHGGGCHGTHD